MLVEYLSGFDFEMKSILKISTLLTVEENEKEEEEEGKKEKKEE